MVAKTPHSTTPTLRVRDNRDLLVRTVKYNRIDPDQPARALIERQLTSDDGLHNQRWDARLFALWQGDASVSPNLSTRLSRAGQVLRSDSVDAGWSVGSYDAAGQVAWRQDGRGTVSRTAFDRLARRVGSHQRGADEAGRAVERHVYGDPARTMADPGGHNARGRRVRHYHDAGLQAVPSY